MTRGDGAGSKGAYLSRNLGLPPICHHGIQGTQAPCHHVTLGALAPIAWGTCVLGDVNRIGPVYAGLRSCEVRSNGSHRAHLLSSKPARACKISHNPTGSIQILSKKTLINPQASFRSSTLIFYKPCSFFFLLSVPPQVETRVHGVQRSGSPLVKLAYLSGFCDRITAMKKNQRTTPRFLDPEALEILHQERLQRAHARVGKRTKTFTFANYPAQKLRELSIKVQGGAVGYFSFSELMELLLAHWEQHPPDPRFILDFEFQTKNGRPRRSV